MCRNSVGSICSDKSKDEKTKLLAARLIRRIKTAMANRPATKWNRVLLNAGLFLVALGVFHVAIQILFPRSWESSIGWRKPILFGVSTGATLVSLAWVASLIRLKAQNFIAWTIALLSCLEVLIITAQTWRGVPAHFNNGAAVDRILANSVDAMLIIITLCIFYLTWKTISCRSKPENSDYLLAARHGMIYLSLACVFGFATAIYGNLAVAANANPELILPRGVLKFVHGMPLHAIQILPLWALALNFLQIKLARRTISIWCASGSIFAATVYAAWQTVNGWARFESNVVGWLLIGATAATAVLALLSAFVPLFFASSSQNRLR